jgi:hypothetical protein
MSKLSELKRATLEDFPGAPSWFESYLQFQNSFNEDVHGRINGDIGLVNTTDAIKAVKDCVHGVEKKFRSPLWEKGLRPVGVMAVDSNGESVQTVDWRVISTAGQPDQIGVTVQYDLRHTEPFLSVRKSGNQAINISTNTVITWETLVSNEPAVSTLAGGQIYIESGLASRVRVREAGRYWFNTTIPFAANATGFRVVWLSKNGTITGAGSRPGEVLVDAAAAPALTSFNVSAPFDLTTSDYVEVWVYQTGVNPLNVLGNAAEEAWLHVSREWNSETPSAAVTFRVMGG